MKKNWFKYIYMLCSLSLFSCFSDLTPLPLEKEHKYTFSTETNLQDNTYSKKIEDFYYNGKEGVFTGKVEVPIYYKTFEQSIPQKAIVISAGRTEAAIKYKELIYDLYQNGYSVYIHDHRGQGLSGRMTKNPDMGHIDDFQYYIDDLKFFYNQYVAPKDYEKTYLLAHSMGGAIGITYLEQHPKDFTAAAFSSPMLGFSPYIEMFVKFLVTDAPKYALGQSDYKDTKEDFKENTLTGSQLRFDRMIDAFEESPKAKLGGATYSWVYKSKQQFSYLFNHIDKIETPFLLLSAQNEEIVRPYAQKKFVSKAKKLKKDCIAFEVKNAQHELFIEKDKQRTASLTAVLDFYNKY